MRFFIPSVKDDQLAEEMLGSIKKHLKATSGFDVTDRRIFRIEHKHYGEKYVVEVGQPHPVTRETVFAILEAPAMNLFLVCTPNRAVLGGDPILVGQKEVYSVTDFE